MHFLSGSFMHCPTSMLSDKQQISWQDCDTDITHQVECLVPGNKPRSYKPLLERQKCGMLKYQWSLNYKSDLSDVRTKCPIKILRKFPIRAADGPPSSGFPTLSLNQIPWFSMTLEWFLSKGQWTYGPTLCLSIDTHIRSNCYRVVDFWVFLTKKQP